MLSRSPRSFTARSWLPVASHHLTVLAFSPSRAAGGVDTFDIEVVAPPARPAPVGEPTPVQPSVARQSAEPSSAPRRDLASAKSAVEAPLPSPSGVDGVPSRDVDDARREQPVDAPAPPASEPRPGAVPRDEYSPEVSAGSGARPGVAGKPVWALPGAIGPMPDSAPAATAPPAPRPVDTDVAGDVLRGTLQTKDKDLGLDLPAGGVVASTLASAVRASAAPPDSRATFEVELGSGGRVQGVRVVSSTKGDAKTWENVARAAAASLGAKNLNMGADPGEGATVTVKVESKNVFPAGSKKKVDVKPVCANEVIEQVIDALNDPSAIGEGRGHAPDPAAATAVRAQDPSGRAAEEEQRRRFCIPPIGIAGKGDLSNIGAHAQTQIRSTYTVKRIGRAASTQNLPSEVQAVDTNAPWLEAKGPRKPPKPRKKKKGQDKK